MAKDGNQKEIIGIQERLRKYNTKRRLKKAKNAVMFPIYLKTIVKK